MNNKWSPASWRKKPAKHIPSYKDVEALSHVIDKLKQFPPLVFAGEARNLEKQLGEVAKGKAFYFKVETVLNHFQIFIQIISEIHLR